jgi:nitrite reductase/ring-hydroxylating ferredoxin subunit
MKTELADGIIFGNKLYCPKHGCQYDVTNGYVE